MKKKTRKKKENNHFLRLEVQNITCKSAFLILDQDAKKSIENTEKNLVSVAFYLELKELCSFGKNIQNSEFGNFPYSTNII
jgi:hypothetical protein